MKDHHYQANLKWTGNNGTGTAGYKSYERSHEIRIGNKPVIAASSDPAFRGDETKHNPEELLLASISSCHMLWYLHLCSVSGITVISYTDHSTGTMVETPDGGGHFTEVTLHPAVTILESTMADNALELHSKANKLCYIANSLNFPVHHKPTIIISS